MDSSITPSELDVAGRPLLFMHIPKTSGTALNTMLRKVVPADKIMPSAHTNLHPTHPTWSVNAPHYDLFGLRIHLDHDRIAALAAALRRDGREPLLLTMLRSPRERIMSRYREWRGTPEASLAHADARVQEAYLMARRHPFERFLLSDHPVVVNACDNLQARMLAGLGPSRTQDASAILRVALTALDTYHVIGRTDEPQRMVDALEKAYGLVLPAYPHVHVSKTFDHDVMVVRDPEALARLAAYTKLDDVVWQALLRRDGTGMPPHHDQARRAHGATTLFALPSLRGPAPKAGIPDGRAPGPQPQPQLRDAMQEGVTDVAFRRTVPDGGSRAEPLRGEGTLTRLLRTDPTGRVVAFGAWLRSEGVRFERFKGFDGVSPAAWLVVRFAHVFQRSEALLGDDGRIAARRLVISDAPQDDARLDVLLRAIDGSPALAPTCRWVGDGEDRLLVLNLDDVVAEGGRPLAEAIIVWLARCYVTHPATVRTLPDDVLNRRFRTWVFRHTRDLLAAWDQDAARHGAPLDVAREVEAVDVDSLQGGRSEVETTESWGAELRTVAEVGLGFGSVPVHRSFPDGALRESAAHSDPIVRALLAAVYDGRFETTRRSRCAFGTEVADGSLPANDTRAEVSSVRALDERYEQMFARLQVRGSMRSVV